MAKLDKSGTDKGNEYADMLREYLASTDAVPAVNGRLNKKELAEKAGVPRLSLYKNPACVELVQNAITTHQLIEDTDDEKDKLRRKISKLEQNNSDLTAQVYELRRRLKRLQHIEALVEKGRL